MADKKPAARRQRTNSRDVGVIPFGGKTLLSEPSSDWCEEVQQAWDELRRSPLSSSKVMKQTDVPALWRLFDLRHRYILAKEWFDTDPVTYGSQGQVVLSPWAAEMHRLAAGIEKLEDRFGLTPLSRLRLGISMEEGVGLAARNAAFLEQYRNGQAAGE